MRALRFLPRPYAIRQHTPLKYTRTGYPPFRFASGRYTTRTTASIGPALSTVVALMGISAIAIDYYLLKSQNSIPQEIALVLSQTEDVEGNRRLVFSDFAIGGKVYGEYLEENLPAWKNGQILRGKFLQEGIKWTLVDERPVEEGVAVHTSTE